MFSKCLADGLCPGVASPIVQGLLFLVPLVLALLLFAAGTFWYWRTSRRSGESRELTRRTVLYFVTPGLILLAAGLAALVLHMLRS